MAITTLHEGRFIDVNDAFLEATGFEREEVVGRSAAQIRLWAGPVDRDRYIRELQATGGVSNFECHFRRVSGEIRSGLISSRLIEANGETLIVSSVVDITERKRAEDALRESEQRFRMVVGNSLDGINILDLRSGRYTFMSPAQVKLTGFTEEEILNTPAHQALARVHPEDRELSVRQQQAVASGATEEISVEYRWRVKSGEYRWFSDKRKLVRDDSGNPAALVGLSRDITDRKRVESALEQERARAENERGRLQAIVDTIPVGLFIAEASGRVAMTNERAKRIWAGAVPLEKISDYAEYVGFWPGTRERLRAEDWPAAQALIHGRTTNSVMVDIQRFDRTRGTILLSGAPIKDAAGSTTGAVVAIEDVSELKEVQARLEEADRRKNEFLAVLSHELRNPLAPIRNSVFILQHAAPGGAQAARAREVIERQVRHMAQLVDDLLEVTRITQGKIRLQRGPLEVNELVRRCADDYRPTFAEAGIAFQVLTPDEPVHLDGDAARLAQVIGNLLSNAAKFTPAGGRTALTVEATDDEVRLRVRDTGVGMAPDLIERVFEPFVQADHTLDRTEGGLGLGLAVLKGLVELHGGAVSARSEGLGKGAEFTVTLPLAKRPAEQGGPVAPVAASSRRRVLVIEDSADAAESLRMVLELHGHEVEVAGSGREGVEIARRLKPDLVLCDIGLPDMDGYAVGRALRAEAATAGIRLVALSGYAQPEDIERSREAGFDRHLAKPVEPKDLADV